MTTFQLSAETSTTQSPTSIVYDDYTDSDNEDDLPYPGELPRNDFLTPDFNPQTYLSTLRNRHQTLEDLRSDLRQRSQLLNQELLDLVNNNYEEFLGLGADLKGGEEKVQGVRVGLLGFEREVDGIRKVVAERKEEVGSLLTEKKQLRTQVVFGRALLEMEKVIAELEESFAGLSGASETLGVEEEDTDDDDGLESDSGVAILVKKHRKYVEKYLLLRRSVNRLGVDHPFLQVQLPRVEELGRKLSLDLRTALKQAKLSGDTSATLTVMELISILREEAEGIKALNGG